VEPILSVPFIAARVIHFASTVMIAGIFIFLFFVEAPALRKNDARTWPGATVFHSRLLCIAWLSLAISIASGVAWLLLLATNITGSSLAQVISDGTAQTLLTRTQFGHDWEARFVLAVLLAAALLRFGRKRGWGLVEGGISTALAMGFLGTLAWSGHGGATPGLQGEVHVTSDVLHLVAAGAWIGGLLPLRLLLSSANQAPDTIGVSIARNATLRFSTLGVLAVATLTITGLVNTWVLVGSVPALVEFQYGRLLLLKLALFVVLLALAAFNRMRLTPRLVDAAASGSHESIDALRRLKRNCLVETALGLAILIVVGALGTISPGMHMHGS
jgi:putative copper resistance protein D